MLLRLLRLIRGYVELEAKGSFPERFLNITARYGIMVWNAQPAPNGLTACMYASDYKQIRKTARRTKMQLKVTRKHGLPFVVKKYKSRLGLFAGALAGLLLIMFLSCFIWSVTISGNTTISEQTLREELRELGVYTGAFSGSINSKAVVRDLQLRQKKVGWMSVNITGNIVSVEIKENVEKPELDTSQTPCNLKAKADGVITELNISNGVTEVLKGSGVQKGDLLVSGVAESNNERVDTIRYLRARGEVFADVISQKELSIPKEYDYYSITENKTERNQLNFLWFSLPAGASFTTYINFASDYSSNCLYLNNTKLPIGFTTQTDYELEENTVSTNAETAQQIFENESLLYEVFSKGDSTLVSRKLNVTETDNNYNCTVDYVFNENIAESVDFSVTE